MRCTDPTTLPMRFDASWNSRDSTRLGRSRISDPGQEGAAHQGLLPFIASRDGQNFHRIDCKWAEKISAEKAVYFKDKAEALQAGKKPCEECQHQRN